jgi:hypothetical protein
MLQRSELPDVAMAKPVLALISRGQPNGASVCASKNG